MTEGTPENRPTWMAENPQAGSIQPDPYEGNAWYWQRLEPGVAAAVEGEPPADDQSHPLYSQALQQADEYISHGDAGFPPPHSPHSPYPKPE